MKHTIKILIASTAIAFGGDNVIINEAFDYGGFAEWKRYVQTPRLTTPGAPLSPYDRMSPNNITFQVPSNDPKERYNQFLRDQGINPRTIGRAVLLPDGKMLVPTVKQEYSNSNE